MLVKCNLEKKGGRMLLSGEYSVEVHETRVKKFLFKLQNMTGEMIWIIREKEPLEPLKMRFV